MGNRQLYHTGGWPMHAKWMRWYGMLAVVLLIAPMVVGAQGQPRGPRWGNDAARPRGEMQVLNDWQDEVTLSLWSHRRERIGEWIIRPGGNVFLEEGGVRIKVRPNYK